MILGNGMALLGIDSVVRLALGVVFGDSGDLHMIRHILDECIEGLEVKAEVRGAGKLCLTLEERSCGPSVLRL
jgi:hypothetical protein